MKTNIGIRLWPVKSFLAALVMASCSDSGVLPDPALNLATNAQSSESATPWGPETPNFNLQVVMHGEGQTMGLIKFRQPNDDQRIAYLETTVRGLAPNSSYQLRRAVDTILDGNCTSAMWLILGKGLVPQDITTDENGDGQADLFRDLASLAPGTTFDIHFQIVQAGTTTVVLDSDCYRYAVSQ